MGALKTAGVGSGSEHAVCERGCLNDVEMAVSLGEEVALAEM